MSHPYAALLAQVEVMLHESGSTKEIDAAGWLDTWLQQPLPALNNEKPADVLDTPGGYEAVSKVLACMQSGAFR